METIEIEHTKVLDWLQDRKLCKQDWNKQQKALKIKAKDVLQNFRYDGTLLNKFNKQPGYFYLIQIFQEL